YAFEVEVAIVVDVRDHDADLVDVAGQHDTRVALGIEQRDGVSADIGADLVRDAAGFLAPDGGCRRLEAGRRRGIEQPLQELERIAVHGNDVSWKIGSGAANDRAERGSPATVGQQAADLADGTCNP